MEDVKKPRIKKEKKGRALRPDEIQSILKHCAADLPHGRAPATQLLPGLLPQRSRREVHSELLSLPPVPCFPPFPYSREVVLVFHRAHVAWRPLWKRVGREQVQRLGRAFE